MSSNILKGFTKKKIEGPEEDLGILLKQEREKNNLSLEQVVRRTRIRKRYLEALESNDYKDLPHETYTCGILKIYADLLKLDSNKIAKVYKRNQEILKNIKQANEPKMPHPINSPSFIITPKTFLIAFICLISVVILGYIGYQFFVFSSPPSLTITYPPDGITVKNNSIAIEGEVKNNGELFINDQNLPIESNGKFRTIVSLQNGVNVIKISAKNKLGKEKILSRKVLAEIPETNIGQQKTVSQSFEMVIKATPNSSWVQVESDGKDVYEGVMLPGTSQFFTASEYILITTKNAGSTEIILNGKNLGKMGQEGEIKKAIRYDKNNLSN